MAKCFQTGFTTALLMCSLQSNRELCPRTSGGHVLHVSFPNPLHELGAAIDVNGSIFTKKQINWNAALCANGHGEAFHTKTGKRDAFIKSRASKTLVMVKIRSKRPTAEEDGAALPTTQSNESIVRQQSVRSFCDKVLWRNMEQLLLYLSRLIPDLPVRSTSYESSSRQKQTRGIVTLMAATPESKHSEMI